MADAPAPISLNELNGLGLLRFTQALLPLYGNSGWLAPLSFAQRPFLSIDHLHRALADIVASADNGTKEQMIHLQPAIDTEASVPPFNGEEMKVLQKLQSDYLTMFGFPLVISSLGENPTILLASVALRLTNTREQEITNSLDEASKLARRHLKTLVSE